ncbi:MAG: UDP-galactopyranose mutase [Coriobacteriales bacterium]|jgi:UDP-galactopyranose mutase|nr:UDP-galactopyranose mutase [Coriobacteriales bacterium]
MTDETNLTAHDRDALTSADALIVGAGFAGAVLARELAERGGKKVVILEERPHIGGNAYDLFDETGVLIHQYGPHIYHTNSARVDAYLTRFTAWYPYEHKVLAFIDGATIPVPFNLNSIDASFSADKATRLKAALQGSFTEGQKVPIIDLRKQADPLLKELADYVYEKVFVYYTQKQWGLTPEEIDPAVTARVPVLIGRDNRYFQDSYQGMPRDGYTKLFENLLDHPNITVHLKVDARTVLAFQDSTGSAGEGDGEAFASIEVDGKPFDGILVFTGALDRLCNERFGMLPYRTLDFVYRHFEQKHVQPCGTVNYTVSEDYTRITEFSWLTGQDVERTTTAEEYSKAYEGLEGQIPYYAINNPENQAAYERYLGLFSALPNFHVLGRLAEYKYYNIDQIVLRALELADELI